MKRGESIFFQFIHNAEMQIVVCYNSPIHWKSTGKHGKTDFKLIMYTDTYSHTMQASLYSTGRKLIGTQFVQQGEWYSACCFCQKAGGRPDWFKRYVPVPCG